MKLNSMVLATRYWICVFGTGPQMLLTSALVQEIILARYCEAFQFCQEMLAEFRIEIMVYLLCSPYLVRNYFFCSWG